MNILISLIFPAVGFILQTYTRIFNQKFGVDVWTRLLETDHVRKAGHKIPGKIGGQFIIEGYFDYPPIFPFILSFLNKKTLEKYQGLIAPFFDSLNNLLVFWAAFHFTQNLGISLFAQAVYTISPVMSLENSSLTPRSLGYLNFNLAFLSSILFVDTGNVLFLVSSLIFTTLIFLSHRFAMQSLFFVSLFLLFYNRNWFYIAIFLTGFCLAVLITKGYYLRVLKGHLYNIYFWIPNRYFRFAHQIRGIEKWSGKKDFVELVYIMLSKFAPLSMVGTNLWVTAPLFILLYKLIPLSFIQLSIPGFIYFFTLWVVFFYSLGIPILMTAYLRCIGEGYRYLEMAALPASIVASWLFFSLVSSQYSLITVLVYAALFCINFGLILYVHYKIINDRNRSVTPEMAGAFKFLNRQKKIFRVLCIPHQNTTNVLYHTKHQVFVNADNKGLREIEPVYPVIKWPLIDTIKKYNLNLIFLKESFAKTKELRLRRYKEVFRSGDIVLLKI